MKSLHFRRLTVRSLDDAIDQLALHPCAETMQGFFVTLMQLPEDEKQQAIERLVSEAPVLYDENLAAFILRLNHPHDIGLFAPLFLNCLTLQPVRQCFSPRNITCLCAGGWLKLWQVPIMCSEQV